MMSPKFEEVVYWSEFCGKFRNKNKIKGSKAHRPVPPGNFKSRWHAL